MCPTLYVEDSKFRYLLFIFSKPPPLLCTCGVSGLKTPRPAPKKEENYQLVTFSVEFNRARLLSLKLNLNHFHF